MKIMYILILQLIFTSLTAQQVEVQGSLKVSQMDTLNSEEMLVVKTSNGTLATRQASSLVPPTDTTRTFERDLEFAKLMCNCSSLPPFLVESALENGYTEADLLAAGANLLDIINGGGDPLELFNAGASPVQLVAAGVPDSIFLGLEYAGGFIFHIDGTTGFGLVASGATASVSTYGCENMDLPAAEGQVIGTGQANTTAIVNTCGITTVAYFINNLTFNDYSDWYIPSSEELAKAFNVLVDMPGTQLISDQGLQSSTDFPGTSNTDQCLGVFYPTGGPEALTAAFLKDPGGAVVSTTFIRTVN